MSPHSPLVPSHPHSSLVTSHPHSSLVTSHPHSSYPHSSLVTSHPHSSLVPSHPHSYPHSSLVPSHPHSSLVTSHPHSSLVTSHPHSSLVTSHPHSSLVTSHPHSSLVPSHPHSSLVPSHPHSSLVPSHPHSSLVPSHPHSSLVPSHPHSSLVPSHPHSSLVPSHPHSSLVTSHPHSSLVTSHPHSSLVTSHPHSSLVPSHPHSSLVTSHPHSSLVTSHPHSSLVTSSSLLPCHLTSSLLPCYLPSSLLPCPLPSSLLSSHLTSSLLPCHLPSSLLSSHLTSSLLPYLITNTSLPTLITSVSTLTTSVSTLITSVSTLTTSVSTLTTSVSTLTTSVSTLTTSLPTLTTSLPTLTTSLPTLTTSLPTLTTSLPTLTTSLSTLTTSLSTLTTTHTPPVSTLTSSLPTLTTSLPTLTTSLSTLTTAHTPPVSTLTTLLPTLTSSLPTLTSSLPTLTTSVPTLTTSVLTLTSSLHLSGALDEEESDGEGSSTGGEGSGGASGVGTGTGTGTGSGSAVIATASVSGPMVVSTCGETLNPQERHQLRHRELFLSRQIETLPATHIRGKCTVTLLNETELLLAYLNKDDTFFYSLVYDPQQKTLLADKGEIRVGSRYQADITSILKEGEGDGRNLEELESLVWTPSHGLTDRQIDQFLVMSRSVGTFARALDCSSSVKQPSLHMSAAAASRDVTLFHAMDTLHKHNYDISKALCSLIPATGPVLCRDEMEEWSASEANLFEEALEKYGKDFNDIRQDFLPWKTLKNIIEYYYMWKTTDRYVQQKRVKAVEAESKLKQVYIPNYNKPNPAALTNGKTTTTTTPTTPASSTAAMVNGADISLSGKACESCHATSSSQWYAWGPSHLQCRLCNSCWQYWKKFGGLKLPSRIGKEEERLHSGGSRSQRCNVGGCGREYKTRSQLVRHAATAHGVALRPGSPRPIMKTRAAIMVHTSIPHRIMRRLCQHIVQPRKAARNPTFPINAANIRQESLARMGGKTFDDFAYLVRRGPGRRRGRVSLVSVRLGQAATACPAWMLPTESALLPKQPHIAFPKPPKGPDGSLIYTPVPNKELPVVNNASPTLLKRRAYEEINGMDGLPPAKRQKEAGDLESLHLNQLGVVPPPGLTVTPVGINGGPCLPPPPPGAPTPPLTLPGHPTPTTPSRAKIATVSRVGGRPRIISWMDAPDDVYFYATDTTKKLRKSLSTNDLKRAARRPWKRIQENESSPPMPTPITTPVSHLALDQLLCLASWLAPNALQQTPAHVEFWQVLNLGGGVY
ncbi:hypothetical protein Pcinc_016211 [Petrolisthes cinctipes]|uniref:Metastasis-associated protein MTA1 n=1 Tax=Petrolisthes cinctipes TaxID=88211 RepID=A0AAE1KPR0_PETCI|nr:hypothetical protein Pcinc_016211 [Petrolisthes cinctipes]